MGIEPTWPAWKAGVLPLNYTRLKSLRKSPCILILKGVGGLSSTPHAPLYSRQPCASYDLKTDQSFIPLMPRTPLQLMTGPSHLVPHGI